MKLAIPLSKQDVEMAVFMACSNYNNSVAPEVRLDSKEIADQTARSVNVLWENRKKLLNKMRVKKSRAGGSSVEAGLGSSSESQPERASQAAKKDVVDESHLAYSAEWDFHRRVATLRSGGSMQTASKVFSPDGCKVLANFSVDGLLVKVPVTGVWWGLVKDDTVVNEPVVFRRTSAERPCFSVFGFFPLLRSLFPLVVYHVAWFRFAFLPVSLRNRRLRPRGVREGRSAKNRRSWSPRRRRRP